MVCSQQARSERTITHALRACNSWSTTQVMAQLQSFNTILVVEIQRAILSEARHEKECCRCASLDHGLDPVRTLATRHIHVLFAKSMRQVRCEKQKEGASGNGARVVPEDPA